MASNATNTNASASIATTVAQVAGHAVVKTVTAVASQVQKNNSADLKDIVSNVSKEVVAAKAEDAPTLIEKVEEASKEVVKDVVTGVESAAKDVEAHPELIAEGAVVAAVGAVGLVAPALAVGGVAVLGKMAADSAMKTLDGIVTDSSSKVVKEISSDLAKDVGDEKKPLDTPAPTQTEVTAGAKAVTTVDRGEATTAKVNQQATSSNTSQDGTTIVAVTTKKVAVATPDEAPSNPKPVTASGAQIKSKSTPSNPVDQKSAPPMILDPTSQPVVAAAVAVAYKQPTSTLPSTAAPVAPSAVVSPPVVSPSQESTIGSETIPSDKGGYTKSTSAPILAGSTTDDSFTHLRQKLDSINENLQGKDLSELFQKMDAMHTTLQTIATLLTSIAQGQTQLQPHIPTDPRVQSAVEVSTIGVSPPVSLITPPLPPTTVETRSEMTIRDDQDVNAAVGTSEVQSTPPAGMGGHTSKRSGLFEGLGKFFYLRS